MAVGVSILTYVGAVASPCPRLRKEVTCHDGNAPKEGTAKMNHIAATLNWQIISTGTVLPQARPRPGIAGSFEVRRGTEMKLYPLFPPPVPAPSSRWLCLRSWLGILPYHTSQEAQAQVQLSGLRR